jgi:hypothetical protein
LGRFAFFALVCCLREFIRRLRIGLADWLNSDGKFASFLLGSRWLYVRLRPRRRLRPWLLGRDQGFIGAFEGTI